MIITTTVAIDKIDILLLLMGYATILLQDQDFLLI